MNLKEELIAEIQKIDDQVILEQLTNLVRGTNEKIAIEFTEDQLQMIDEAKNQVKEGNFHQHDAVMKMIGNA